MEEVHRLRLRLCLNSVSTTFPTPTEPPASAPFAVIGYFPDYRDLNSAWAQSLTDILYFSAEPRADGTLDTSRLNEETWQSLHQLKTEHATRIHLSIGGWERDGDFSLLTANPNTRHAFIENLLNYLLAHNLDGADFDWEFPEKRYRVCKLHFFAGRDVSRAFKTRNDGQRCTACRPKFSIGRVRCR